MEKVVLEQIEIQGNRVCYHYTVSEGLKKFFSPEMEYYIEYQKDHTSVSMYNVPDGILAIPFVTNILPIIWLNDAELIVPELDGDFFDSIPEFQNGYINMYPDAFFGGKITAGKIVKETVPDSGKCAMFFSGGVDSWCTLVRHLEEKPDLIALWGSDIPITEQDGWSMLRKSLSGTAEQTGLSLVTVKTSFRKIIDEGRLSREFYPVLHDGWWHGVQHGIAIIGHAAPYNYLHGIRTVYIAATYSSEFKGRCASDPSIDNYVRFCGCRVVDDSCIPRIQKIKIISDYRKKIQKNINIHVCWVATDGENCCRCEKCYRTIFGLLLEGENPENYGFRLDDTVYEKMRDFMSKYSFAENPNLLIMWKEMKLEFKRRRSFLLGNCAYDKIKWIESFDPAISEKE